MRVESTRYTERFGAARVNDVQKVLELDSGRAKDLPLHEKIAVQKIEEDVIKDIEEKMAIVIPTKDEKLQLFDGVISGVPHESLIIVVSNSKRSRVDRFRMERDALSQFCHFTRRPALIVHQKDPFLAKALTDAGYTHILDEEGKVRNGKAEGMMVGILMAMAAGKEYVGFIDADNYFPGAVWEYVKCYAAGFSMARSPYSMTRIIWRYKPKLSGGLHFKKWGRVSTITNRCMNSLISARTGFETDVIKTGNAGEHAMSMKLAMLLPFASNYAVEPQELVSIFEGFGGVMPTFDATSSRHGVDMFQIETRNPHLHEEKGSVHLQEMLLPGLGTIYHSALCDKDTKALICEELCRQNVIADGEEPPKPLIAPPLKTMNLRKFTASIEEHMHSYSALEKE